MTRDVIKKNLNKLINNLIKQLIIHLYLKGCILKKRKRNKFNRK